MSKELSNTYTQLGYGQIPYFIIRECSGIYRQIPIHFEVRELETKDGIYIRIEQNGPYDYIIMECLKTLKSLILEKINAFSHLDNSKVWFIVGKHSKEGCLVLNPQEAIYLNTEGEKVSDVGKIPFGGTLISVSGSTILTNGKHFNF